MSSDLFDAPPTPPSLPDGCLGCARLEDPACTTVTLLSGAVVCSWCPSWLEETRARQEEANYVLRLVDRPTRLDHLAKREAEFGAEYRRRLEAVVLETWQRRRAAASGAANG